MNENPNTMKTLMTSLMLITILALSAQQRPTKASITIEDQQHPATAMLLDLPIDEARDRYEDYVSDRYDIDVDGNGWLSNKSLLRSEKVTLDELSTNTVDLFAHFESVDEDETRLTLSAREGYDLFYSANYKPERYSELQDILAAYAQKARHDYHSALLEERRKQREDLIRDKEKLAKDISKNKEDIQKNLEDNREMSEENEKMSKELNSVEEELKDLEGEIKMTKEKVSGG